MENKELNKKEMIDLFINYFNSHRELFPEISEKLVRDRLNLEIKQVEYVEQNGLIKGGWNPNNGKIEIVNGVESIHIIMHELTHLLSTSQNNLKEIEKVGLNLYFKKTKKDIGIGINEGITDAIAEILSGQKNSGYQVEKNAAYMLFSLIGIENVLKHFHDNNFFERNPNIGEDFEFSNFFETDILAQYEDVQKQEEVKSLINRMSNIVDKITELNSKSMQRN